MLRVPSPTPAARIGLIVLATVIIAALVSISLWPTHVDQALDIDPRFHRLVESCANVAFYLPLGILARICLPRVSGAVVIALGCLTSGCFELLQAVLPIDRTPAIIDVATNTVGVAIGWWVAGAVVRDRRGD